MIKFAHMGDCHLGGWRQPEMQALNMLTFRTALRMCIKEKVECIIISGDLFDSAYPPIETLKDAFEGFREVQEHKIGVFFIAGSHDYSASGRSFLDVLERAGLGVNCARYEQRGEKIMLLPTLYKGLALYGYPGKKSGLEVPDIANIVLQESPGMYRILMLHTALKDAVKNLPIPSVDETKLPKVEYLALSHLHIQYCKENRVYSGPLFPNNLQELEELQGGSFYIIEGGQPQKKKIALKQTVIVTASISDGYLATTQIKEELEKHQIRDAIVILKIKGILERGKISDISFEIIEAEAKKQGAYVLLRSTTEVQAQEYELIMQPLESEDIEVQLLQEFKERNPSPFNTHLEQMLHILESEKKEEEKTNAFEQRIAEEVKKGIL